MRENKSFFLKFFLSVKILCTKKRTLCTKKYHSNILWCNVIAKVRALSIHENILKNFRINLVPMGRAEKSVWPARFGRGANIKVRRTLQLLCQMIRGNLTKIKDKFETYQRGREPVWPASSGGGQNLKVEILSQLLCQIVLSRRAILEVPVPVGIHFISYAFLAHSKHWITCRS